MMLKAWRASLTLENLERDDTILLGNRRYFSIMVIQRYIGLCMNVLTEPREVNAHSLVPCQSAMSSLHSSTLDPTRTTFPPKRPRKGRPEISRANKNHDRKRYTLFHNFFIEFGILWTCYIYQSLTLTWTWIYLRIQLYEHRHTFIFLMIERLWPLLKYFPSW